MKEFIYQLQNRLNVQKEFSNILEYLQGQESELDQEVKEMIDNNLNSDNIVLFYETCLHLGHLGQHFTPESMSELVYQLTKDNEIKEVYEPTIGTGNLILNHYKNGWRVKGQEIDKDTYNINSVIFKDLDIRLGDTLKEDKFQSDKFNLIVSNPPFSLKWDQNEDARYPILAPKSKADWAFIQHCFYKLEENGRAFMIMPHGVLFRGAKERDIRKSLIKNIRTIISLPPNMFQNTGIPTILIEITKQENDNILFIDNSSQFEKVKKFNILTGSNIATIVDTYKNRIEEDKYSKIVGLEEIKENDYNLNIPRYIDTFEEEEPINIVKVMIEEHELKLKIEASELKLFEMMKELKIDGVDLVSDLENKASEELGRKVKLVSFGEFKDVT